MEDVMDLRIELCRAWAQGRRIPRPLRVQTARRHELLVQARLKPGTYHIRYYPAVGRIHISGPSGRYIGWADSLPEAFGLMARADTNQVLPAEQAFKREETEQ